MKKQEITKEIERLEGELKQLREKVAEEEVTYCRGDRFEVGFSSTPSVLALISTDYGCKMSLITLDGGNRWREPMKVKDAQKVTQSEIYLMCGTSSFKKI